MTVAAYVIVPNALNASDGCDLILSPEECRNAAAQIGVIVHDDNFQTENNDAWLPGCYLEQGNKVWYNYNLTASAALADWFQFYAMLCHENPDQSNYHGNVIYQSSTGDILFLLGYWHCSYPFYSLAWFMSASCRLCNGYE